MYEAESEGDGREEGGGRGEGSWGQTAERGYRIPKFGIEPPAGELEKQSQCCFSRIPEGLIPFP